MLDILQYLPAKRKSSPSGWLSFNAVCCQHNGDSQDRRQRGGLKVTEQGWSYHCFNCGYTASFQLGRHVNYKAKRLLGWLGVGENEINTLNLESLRHRSINGILEDRTRQQEKSSTIEFDEVTLPDGLEVLTPDRKDYWEYAQSRYVPDTYPIMVYTDSDNITGPVPTRAQIIVPFTHNNRLVGWTARMLDDRKPKYLNNMQPGYVFGTDLQHPDWQHALVVEGIFDALSIGGLAVMHATISDAQVKLIRSLGREVTVVPDQDHAGLALIDRAIELGWAVSIPDWHDCKDVNDAVKKYGRLATILSIFKARETSRIKIELKKKHLIKKINELRTGQS